MNIRSTSIRGVLLAGAMLGCGSAWAVSPEADPATVTRTEKVMYKPSEAASPEGAAKLYERLEAAAYKVCEDTAKVRLDTDPAFAACVRDALDKAVRQVGLPTVSMLHRYGGRMPVMASR